MTIAALPMAVRCRFVVGQDQAANGMKHVSRQAEPDLPSLPFGDIMESGTDFTSCLLCPES